MYHDPAALDSGALSDETVESLREQFPVLATTMHGKSLCYLDSGATSLKPNRVIDAEAAYYRTLGANIHRGVYELSARTDRAFDEARAAVGRFIGAGGEGEVVFTHGATESLNIVARGWAMTRLRPGDQIVCTEFEHHANLVPWQWVAAQTGAVLRFLHLQDDGTLDERSIDTVIGPSCRVVAVSAMSNVSGYRPPLDRIIARAHSVGAVVVVDGAQYVSHHPIDVATLGCDFLAFSGHKMCGPTGVGVLYGRRELLGETEPLLYGGDMIREVWADRAEFAGLPAKLEAGTPNIAGVIGLHEAVRFLDEVGMPRIAEHEASLTQYALARLGELASVRVYGPGDPSIAGGVVSFNVAGVHPHDIGTVLDAAGVAVRTGFHCAQPLMRHYGVSGTVRASFALYNTPNDVDRLASAVAQAIRLFGS